MPINPPEAPKKAKVPNRYQPTTPQTDLMFKFNQPAATEAPGAPVQPQVFAQGQGQLNPNALFS